MPLFLLLLLFSGGAGAVYVATKKKAPPPSSILDEAGTPSSEGGLPVTEDAWYRVQARASTSFMDGVKKSAPEGQSAQALLHEAMRTSLESMGFKNTQLVTQDPTTPDNWVFITQGSTTGQLLPSPDLHVNLVMEVETPPSSLLHPATPKSLDVGIPPQDVVAISYALAYEGSPANLLAFSGTLVEDFPIAGALLRAKSHLINLDSALMAKRQESIVEIMARKTIATRAPAAPSQISLQQERMSLDPQLRVAGVLKKNLARARIAGLIPTTAGTVTTTTTTTWPDMSAPGDALKAATSDIGDAVKDTWDRYAADAWDKAGGFVEILNGWIPGALIWQIETGFRLIDAVANDKDVLATIGDEATKIAKAVKAVSPIIALVPGIGAGVATMIDVSCGLALGEPLDQIALDIAANQVPGGAVAKAAFNVAVGVGKDLLAGKDWTVLALDAARTTAINAARSAGVPMGEDGAAVLFDAGLALSRGKSLQEAGFQGLFAFTKGNDILNKGAFFARAMVVAAQSGKDVREVLEEELIHDVGYLIKTKGVGILDSQLRPLLANIVKDPKLLQNMPADLAREQGVDEVIANAALACGKSIAPDTVILDAEMVRKMLNAPPTAVPSGAIALIKAVMVPNSRNFAYMNPQAAQNRFREIQMGERVGQPDATVAMFMLRRAQLLVERQKWVDKYLVDQEKRDLNMLSHPMAAG